MGDVEKLSDAELAECLVTTPHGDLVRTGSFICEAARRLRTHPAPAKADEERARKIVRKIRDRSAGEFVYSDAGAVQILADALDAAAERPAGWRTIDSAPKDGTWVHLFGDGPGFASCNFIGFFGIRSGYSDDEPTWRRTGWQAEPTLPTHWRPLPPPPTQE